MKITDKHLLVRIIFVYMEDDAYIQDIKYLGKRNLQININSHMKYNSIYMYLVSLFEEMDIIE